MKPKFTNHEREPFHSVVDDLQDMKENVFTAWWIKRMVWSSKISHFMNPHPYLDLRQ